MDVMKSLYAIYIVSLIITLIFSAKNMYRDMRLRLIFYFVLMSFLAEVLGFISLRVYRSNDLVYFAAVILEIAIIGRFVHVSFRSARHKLMTITAILMNLTLCCLFFYYKTDVYEVLMFSILSQTGIWLVIFGVLWLHLLHSEMLIHDFKLVFGFTSVLSFYFLSDLFMWLFHRDFLNIDQALIHWTDKVTILKNIFCLIGIIYLLHNYHKDYINIKSSNSNV